MAAILTKAGITEAELMALGSDARVEVVNGEIVEMSPVGYRHGFVAGNVYFTLRPFVTEHKLGYVQGDSVIYLNKDGDRLIDARVPDASFVRKGRIPTDFDLSKPFPGAPDLAVEVMSPDDKVSEVLTKVREYLNAGTDEVWVMYPEQEELHQYRRATPDTVRVYRGDDQIDASALFPGIVLVARELFALPDLD